MDIYMNLKMVKYIRFEQCYENQVVELWNECCYFDPITIEKFRKQALYDDNFDNDLCEIALDGDMLVGFILATKRKFPYMEKGLEPTRAWINVMFVKKEYRNKGIGERLYKDIEDKLIQLKTQEITLAAYSPGYFFGGLDEEHYPEAASFFKKMGYIRGERHVSMGKDLHGYQIPQEVLEKKKEKEKLGFKFINFKNEYALKLIEFFNREFPGGWKRNALISLRDNTAEDRIIIILDKNDEVCGFCLRAIDSNPIRFGPIGIAEKYRSEGLGTILLDMGCYEMTKKGLYHMFFMTTSEQARKNYERNGLSVVRTCVDYRKKI